MLWPFLLYLAVPASHKEKAIKHAAGKRKSVRSTEEAKHTSHQLDLHPTNRGKHENSGECSFCDKPFYKVGFAIEISVFRVEASLLVAVDIKTYFQTMNIVVIFYFQRKTCYISQRTRAEIVWTQKIQTGMDSRV